MNRDAPELEIDVREADYASERTLLLRIRCAVFVDEQRVPAEIETDARDPFCIHELALEAGVGVGTGRIDLARNGKIGRLAVLASKRGRGIGSALMAGLHAIARRHGLDRAWCHAQVAAAAFYEKQGYRIVSGTFPEAGIEHVRMERDLK